MEMEAILLEAMRKAVGKGKRVDGGFKKAT
jgi:hypothetical protein